MAITIDDFSKIWASTSPLTPYEFSENNYKQGWNFIGGTPPSRQMWDFLQKNNDEKMQYLANNYLPLSGGTMTGNLKGSRTDRHFGISNQNSDYGLALYGYNGSENSGANVLLFSKDALSNAGIFQIIASDGTNKPALQGKPDGTLTWDENNVITSAGGTINGQLTLSGTSSNYKRLIFDNSAGGGSGGGVGAIGNGLRLSSENFSKSDGGARIELVGRSATTNPGEFAIRAVNSQTNKVLFGRPDGTLTWDGQPIQTSSDKRLKQDFSDVPADVLEAWGKVNWQQFKYKADVERKGENCRFHTGLVAQDVKEVGEENNVDLLKYGILCHDVREATEEQEAVDLWTVRYEEALAMEVIYLRNEIKKLHEEIKALRTE